jgi:hypothetical protein
MRVTPPIMSKDALSPKFRKPRIQASLTRIVARRTIEIMGGTPAFGGSSDFAYVLEIGGHMMRNSRPNSEQIRIAKLLGIDVTNDTEAVAAARIEDAVSPAIFPAHPT